MPKHLGYYIIKRHAKSPLTDNALTVIELYIDS